MSEETRSRLQGSGRSVRHGSVSGAQDAVLAPQGSAGAASPVSGGVSVGSGVVDDSQSRALQGPRLGGSVTELGLLVSYNSGANTAMVQMLGASANVVGPLPVSKGLASALLVAGAQVLVVLLDGSNPSDGAVVSVW